MIIKSTTPLMNKVQTYIRWKYSGKRYAACAGVSPSGMIKVLTVSDTNSGDYYHEWVSPRTMNLELKENKLLTPTT